MADLNNSLVMKRLPSGLGPFLWKVFMQRLLDFLKEEGYLAVAYADDLLLILHGLTRSDLEERGKKAIEIVEKWAKEHNINISKDKSLSLYLRKPSFLKRSPIFRIQKHRLNPQQSSHT